MEWGALRRVFLFPAIVIVLGCVPGLNLFLYSGHGGPLWLVLPFCFPYILVIGAVEVRKLPSAKRISGLEIVTIAVVIYLVLAYPATRWTEHCLTSQLGLPIRPGILFKMAIMPVGLLVPPY